MTSPREKVERDDAERLSGYLSCAGCGWKKHFSSGSHISEQRLLHQVGGRRKGRKQGPIRTLWLRGTGESHLASFSFTNASGQKGFFF